MTNNSTHREKCTKYVKEMMVINNYEAKTMQLPLKTKTRL